MSKNIKLTLEDIKVKSFITNLTKEGNAKLKGRGDPTSMYSSSEDVELTCTCGLPGACDDIQDP